MNNFKVLIKKYSVILVLILLILFFSIMRPDAFPTVNNMFSVLRQSSIVGIAAMGLMFTLLGGGIDLSISSVISFSCVFTAVMVGTWQMNPALAYLINLIVCCVIGCINGAIIVKTHIPAMIGTLAAQTILQGVTYLVCGGKPVYGVPASVKVIGQGYVGKVPVPVIIMAFVIVLVAIILNKTDFGRYFYATGSNEEAARLSGLRTDIIKISSYMISSFLAGISGMIMLGRISTGQPTAGKGLEMDCLTAAVIGGVSLVGGEGHVSTTVAGILIITILKNGMTIMDINEYYQLVISGLIFLAAVCFDGLSKNGKFAVRKGKKNV